jgi:hypothetical protein
LLFEAQDSGNQATFADIWKSFTVSSEFGWNLFVCLILSTSSLVISESIYFDKSKSQ